MIYEEKIKIEEKISDLIPKFLKFIEFWSKKLVEIYDLHYQEKYKAMIEERLIESYDSELESKFENAHLRADVEKSKLQRET